MVVAITVGVVMVDGEEHKGKCVSAKIIELGAKLKRVTADCLYQRPSGLAVWRFYPPMQGCCEVGGGVIGMSVLFVVMVLITELEVLFVELFVGLFEGLFAVLFVVVFVEEK
nr:hypothetical protein [Tanacetum cinerariifolium]